MAYVEGELPLYNNNNGGFFGSDGIWAILLFALIFNGGWGGNGFGGNGNLLYDVNANTNRGFDNLALNNGINSLQTSVSNGFADAEVARCNATTSLLQAINGVSAGLQNCCCENRAATADLKYTIATENCADRAEISNGIRDIIESNTRNTQSILDKLCQQEIDAKNDQIETLRTQLNMANLAASQTAQTAQLIQDNNAQTRDLINRIAPYPTPSYIVANPYAYNYTNGCGCGSIQ